MTCRDLAANIEAIQPNASPQDVARLCLLLANTVEETSQLSDSQILMKAWREMGLKLQAATDQHAAMTAELEALAGRLAAERRTDACLRDLERLYAEMAAAAERGDPHDHALKNTEFHHRIVKASHNPTLERLWSMLEPFSRTYVTASAAGMDLEWLSHRHDGILDAIREGDADKAAETMRAHAVEAAAMIEQMDHPELTDE